MNDTHATPDAPAPAPYPVAPLKPGYATSEAWLTFLISLLGIIPSSGLVQNAPLAAKVVGAIASLVTTAIYTWQRTQLKRDHLALTLAASAAPPAPVA